jgi:hypothetical protein
MPFVKVEIVRFVDAAFPGWVEGVLRDAQGRSWVLVDKVPIFTAAPLQAGSDDPEPGEVPCEIVRTWRDAEGRTRCLIDTRRPSGVATANGETQFEVFREQIRGVAD